MPLTPGASDEIVSHNISELIKAGHQKKQAVAIAMRVAGKAKHGQPKPTHEASFAQRDRDDRLDMFAAAKRGEGDSRAGLSKKALDDEYENDRVHDERMKKLAKPVPKGVKYHPSDGPGYDEALDLSKTSSDIGPVGKVTQDNQGDKTNSTKEQSPVAFIGKRAEADSDTADEAAVPEDRMKLATTPKGERNEDWEGRGVHGARNANAGKSKTFGQRMKEKWADKSDEAKVSKWEQNRARWHRYKTDPEYRKAEDAKKGANRTLYHLGDKDLPKPEPKKADEAGREVLDDVAIGVDGKRSKVTKNTKRTVIRPDPSASGAMGGVNGAGTTVTAGESVDSGRTKGSVMTDKTLSEGKDVSGSSAASLKDERTEFKAKFRKRAGVDKKDTTDVANLSEASNGPEAHLQDISALASAPNDGADDKAKVAKSKAAGGNGPEAHLPDLLPASAKDDSSKPDDKAKVAKSKAVGGNKPEIGHLPDLLGAGDGPVSHAPDNADDKPLSARTKNGAYSEDVLELLKEAGFDEAQIESLKKIFEAAVTTRVAALTAADESEKKIAELTAAVAEAKKYGEEADEAGAELIEENERLQNEGVALRNLIKADDDTIKLYREAVARVEEISKLYADVLAANESLQKSVDESAEKVVTESKAADEKIAADEAVIAELTKANEAMEVQVTEAEDVASKATETIATLTRTRAVVEAAADAGLSLAQRERLQKVCESMEIEKIAGAARKMADDAKARRLSGIATKVGLSEVFSESTITTTSPDKPTSPVVRNLRSSGVVTGVRRFA